MKKFLLLPLFLCLHATAALAEPSPGRHPQIDCETDSKLELYLQKIAQDVYGKKFGCDTPFPESDNNAWYLGDAVSGLCSFDMFSAKELWDTDHNYNYRFSKPTTIRLLMATLQGLAEGDVRCDMSRGFNR